jgi:glycosyltransferase involved in cell wall biosynthesis
VVIPRGVDIARFDPGAISNERLIQLSAAWRVPDGRPIVLLPGRITRWKGQEVLLQALVKLGRGDIFALLVGDDERRPRYRTELLRKIRTLGLEGQVRLVGSCRDMPAAYKLADVVVSASTDPEAFGRVAVEAQAMGRPVIATDHGGSRETVIPGATGWLVPSGDAAALAAALDEALRIGPVVRAELAVKARRHVIEHFTVAHMTEPTIALYSDLLARDRR